MGYSIQLIKAIFFVFIAYTIYIVSKNFSTIRSSHTAADGWFGHGEKRTDDERIIPFKINVSMEAIQDLKSRLKNARISYEPLEDCNDFSYGFNGKYLKHVANYWLNKYNWKYHEGIINSLPQFVTEVEGLKIHFIHAKPVKDNYKVVIPLLILHGWPGNVFEFFKIIPILLDPVQQISSDINVAFEVIAPSIPGFGWSTAPMKKGFNPEVAARIFNKLMIRLGFSRYLLQGGDWGRSIASDIAFYYPKNVIGLHLNMAIALTWKALLYSTIGIIAPRLVYSSKTFHQQVASAFIKDLLEETGYMHIQATKPDTVGAALSDSPIGLAAYILEKFSYGTNTTYRSFHDGGLTKKFTLDELLTIVSIYWFNGNMVNAMRLYKEYFQNSSRNFNRYISSPTGYAVFPEDVIKQSEEAVRTMYNLTHYKEIERGGHFAALEEPKLLAADIIKFVKTIQLE
ncbi:Epoxide hydrolase N terminus family protein [Acanthocheilonema viteae]